MKFSQNLPRNQVPEWSSSYINYKGLKKLIKSAVRGSEDDGGADLAEFFYALDRNLEDVDIFYNKKYAEASRRLRLLYDRYGGVTKKQEEMDKDELEDLMGALLELRSQYRKLQWYGEVNRRGFVKITKKLDKKIATSAAQSRYLATKVDPKAFASNLRVANDTRAINEWLSALSDVKIFDDNASSHSAHSLQRVASRNAVRISTVTLDSLETAIRHDDHMTVAKLVTELPEEITQTQKDKLMLNMLQRSITIKARSCITALLSLVGSLDEADDMNKRNCIHRYVISIGRSRVIDNQDKPVTDEIPDSNSFLPAAELPRAVPSAINVEERDIDKTLGKEDPTIKLLVHVLDNLRPHQRSAMLARDTYGRMPLHYSAQYGLVAATQELIRHMQDWGQFEVTAGIDSEPWQDAEGFAPLHLSVLGGHYRTTKALLLAENWQDDQDEEIHARQRVDKSGAVLMLATKSNFYKIVKLLVEAGVSVNHQDEQGETALHVAARFGFEDCMIALLDPGSLVRPDLELTEKTYGWTALFTACVDGQLAIVHLLLAAGAKADRTDGSGWKPIEHAALRGHLIIAKVLSNVGSDAATPDATHLQPPGSSNGLGASSLGERKSNGTSKDVPRSLEPVKTFGHRYLTNQSMVMVSLGSMDARKNVPAVKLDGVPLADAHATQLDTALSIVVSAQGATGDPTIIDLPVQENISTSPITFMTSDPAKVKLLFDIVPTYAGSKDKVLGRGVALLNTIKPGMGSKRISLQGDLSVPIMSASTLDVIGTANFNFLIITPFSHPNMTITEEQTYWKRTSTMIIGHRGMGKNMAAMKSLQLGENTIPSFIAASNLGASYVEFDVQLTKDLVPVIYHDFLVSETGIDAPVHTLTLEQFLHANEGQTPRQSRPPSPVQAMNGRQNGTRGGRQQRSYSLGAPDGDRVDMEDRMKHTRDYKQKGFKANSRGNFIQAPFATLEGMFKELPPSVGFNIEMKYPMLFESLEQEMDTYAVELNSFVDTVLETVYNLGSNRNVIFSSFHPDICLLLSFKQPSIPVLFLTDAGTAPVGDIRASSLQEAIRFASRWNLLGIVSAAEPLVTCPRLVRVVKQSGLLCFSYGTLNNDTRNVSRQAAEGIDAVIVDSVLAVRKGLQDSEEAAAKGKDSEASSAEEQGKDDLPLRTKEGEMPASAEQDSVGRDWERTNGGSGVKV